MSGGTVQIMTAPMMPCSPPRPLGLVAVSMRVSSHCAGEEVGEKLLPFDHC